MKFKIDSERWFFDTDFPVDFDAQCYCVKILPRSMNTTPRSVNVLKTEIFTKTPDFDLF